MISVTVKIDDVQVTLEGPEEFVREEIRHLTSRIGQNAKVQEESGGQASSQTITEAQSIEQKKPGSHFETVAVLAFCMKQGGKEEFTEDDMRKAYIRAKVRPPKVVGQAIRDAKNKHEYIEEGSARGSYRLSHHGERTVIFDLPRS
jgi:hypothetical protein